MNVRGWRREVVDNETVPRRQLITAEEADFCGKSRIGVRTGPPPTGGSRAVRRAPDLVKVGMHTRTGGETRRTSCRPHPKLDDSRLGSLSGGSGVVNECPLRGREQTLGTRSPPSVSRHLQQSPLRDTRQPKVPHPGYREEPPALASGEPAQLCNCRALATAANRLSSVPKRSLSDFAEASK